MSRKRSDKAKKLKKPKVRRVPVERGDFIGAPDIRVERGEFVTEGFVEDGCRGLRKHHRFDRLARYLHRNAISKIQYKAGKRFTDDAEAAQVSIPSLLDPGRGGGGGPERRLVEVGARVAEATERYRSAVLAMGIVNSRAVIAVCLTNTPADQWAQAVRLGRDDGIAALRIGLQSLAEHYQLDK